MSLAPLARYVFALALAGAACAALAQGYPAKPIRLIVPTAAAGATDTVSRLLAQKLTEQLGQPVVVDNRPGANGNIAAEAAAKSAPDGYTLFIGTIGVMAVNPYVYKQTGYDPVRDFAPVSQLVLFSNILVVHPSLPVANVAELIAFIKARPGKLSYSSSGSGGSPHLSMALFLNMAGLDVVHVPYKGSAPAITDLLSGQVQLSFGDQITTMPHVRAGKLRALAVSGTARIEGAPEIPTVAESGLPGYAVQGWLSLVGPAGMPPEIVRVLNAEVVRAFAVPAVRETLLRIGATPATDTPEELRQFIQQENRKWSALVRTEKITAQ
jgi:tripartite-type tricarboxylate transporter receptor subunit TctC